MYSAMDIIGIAAGIGLGSTFDENSYGNAIIVSLLGGSFLFASVVELIPGELEKMRALHFSVSPIMGSLLFGYGCMAIIGKWA